MTLPTMRSGIVSREFLRIAGGYGSAALGTSPVGGLDIDNAGHLATDGDLTAANASFDAVAIKGDAPSNEAFFLAADLYLDASRSLMFNAYFDGIFRYMENGEAMRVRMSTTGIQWHTAPVNVSGAGAALTLTVRMTLTLDGDLGIGTTSPSEKLHVSGNALVTGDVTAQGGDIVAGTDGGTRGVLTAWDGSGGSAPGCLKLASPNGTVRYLFIEDDGTLKIHSALPTANSNGTEVGTQT